MFLKEIGQLTSIEWSREHLWDVQFNPLPASSAPPKPFNDWFPAADISYPTGIVKTKPFTGPLSEYDIPIGTGQRFLSMTFYDNSVHALLDWFTYWMNSMFGSQVVSSGGGYFVTSYVKTLDLVTRMINISRLNSQRKEIGISSGGSYIDSFLVYPNEVIGFKGGSDPKPCIYRINFVIAGIVSQSYINNMISQGAARRF